MKQHWIHKTNIIFCFGLLLISAILQFFLGAINWNILAWPVNIYATGAFLLSLIAMHLLRKRIYLFSWLATPQAAVSALLMTLLMTVAMGLIRQTPANEPSSDSFGFSRMVQFWPFVLAYFWLTTSLGLTILKHGFPTNWRTLGFQLNHFGLFIALVSATAGNADIQRLKMVTSIGVQESQSVDNRQFIHELPFAVELLEFKIDEYPPKLMIVSNSPAKVLPEGNPQHLLLESNIHNGELLDWEIDIVKNIPNAIPEINNDTVTFKENQTRGATFASYLKAKNHKTGAMREGWVSHGSFLYPPITLQLDQNHNIVMPPPESRHFLSRIKIYTEHGDTIEGNVEVNRPFEFKGWKIYQLSYDESKGRWSELSILELVRDPWLPVVYTGILMMIIGAISLIFKNRNDFNKS